MENITEGDVLSAKSRRQIRDAWMRRRGNQPPRPRSRQNIARAAFEIIRATIVILLPVPDEFDAFGVVQQKLWGAHFRLITLFGRNLLVAWLGSALISGRRAPGLIGAYHTSSIRCEWTEMAGCEG
ncbi:hypothetical protein QA649_35810 [Bradyrhizobium sp. CB1717]|uniref:hypothetical protein n=1 Tax=Bradyrhizobium sp. CB1717 TaxID=3039154 RepID=UPI0024B041F3|nr:hypothetical protein [Bradyrhizobium sp. CB1717]WFU23361.1 hypothetical protein QA649_35810 [Bradyrhizobium sp. CB1717]